MAQKEFNVGGLPVFWTGTVADPSASAYTFTTPDGFYPDFVMVVAQVATTPMISYWVKDINANPGAILCSATATGNAQNLNTYATTNGITVADGSIIIGTDVTNDNIPTTVFAWRYSA